MECNTTDSSLMLLLQMETVVRPARGPGCFTSNPFLANSPVQRQLPRSETGDDQETSTGFEITEEHYLLSLLSVFDSWAAIGSRFPWSDIRGTRYCSYLI